MFISCVNDVWHFYCVEEFVRNCRHVVDTELYRAIASLGVEPVSPGGTFQVGCLRLICKDFTKADMKIGSVEICWNLLKLNFAASNCFNLRLCLSLLIPLLLRKKEAKTFLRNEHSPTAQIEDTSWTWRPDLTTRTDVCRNELRSSWRRLVLHCRIYAATNVYIWQTDGKIWHIVHRNTFDWREQGCRHSCLQSEENLELICNGQMKLLHCYTWFFCCVPSFVVLTLGNSGLLG